MRCQLGSLLAFAEDAEQPPQLQHRLARSLLDRLQRLPRPLGIAVEHAFGGAGLESDHADGVGDDVVQLTRDSRALLGDRGLRLAFQLRRLCDQHCCLAAAADEERRPARQPVRTIR